MKLAEALIIKADIAKKYQSLKSRLAANVLIQEGNSPAEDPERLHAEAVAVLSELENLKGSIDIANARPQADGRSLNTLLAQRDTLTLRVKLLQDTLAATQKEPERYSVREIKWVATIPVAKLQKQQDDLSKQLRELNIRIQELNWKLDLD